MNNDQNAQVIAQALLAVLKPLTQQSTSKMVTANFQPSDSYSDSFARAFRKGSGFMGMSGATPSTPIHRLDISLTCKPGVIGPFWVGFTVDVTDPETNPRVAVFREWPQSGGELDADPAKLPQVVQYIQAVAAIPLTPDNQEAPRQAPEGMY